MMQTQQISLFNLSSKSKSNHLSSNKYDLPADKTENPNIELVSPFFFLGLSVFIDLEDESQEKTAEYILKITGANIIQQEKILDSDVIVTDKEIYKTQLLNQKNSPIFGENQIDPLFSFRNQRSQISTSNQKRKSIVVNPAQIPWAFITKPLSNDRKIESELAQSFNKNRFDEALPPPPPSHIIVPSNTQQYSEIPTNFSTSCFPDDMKSINNHTKNHKNILQSNQNYGYPKQNLNPTFSNMNSTTILPCSELNNTGGMIVVADSTMRTAPNYCLLNQLPEIRLKPLPDGLHFISPFVNDENISKLYRERTETLISNSNIINDSNIILNKGLKKNEKSKKKKSKDGGRSNAAACRYCGICKKSVTDEEKHRSSIEHKQNVSKQFNLVDEFIQSFAELYHI